MTSQRRPLEEPANVIRSAAEAGDHAASADLRFKLEMKFVARCGGTEVMGRRHVGEGVRSSGPQSLSDITQVYVKQHLCWEY